jgi:hypothetical protein
MEALWVLVMVAIIVGALAVGMNRVRRDKEEGVKAVFGTLRLTATELIEGYGEHAKRHSLAGLSAHVDTSSGLSRRIFNTDLASVPAFAAYARLTPDRRRLFLTITGPSTAILRQINLHKESNKHANAGVRARDFAYKVNLLSPQLKSGGQTPTLNE